jgi:hypothetical protein
MVTYYEDHFDGATLNPAWTAWGTGVYSVTGSNLGFTTQRGDFGHTFGDYYGFPKHAFLITPPAGAIQWSAAARMRYNTPSANYQQIDVFAFQDKYDYAKIAYQGTKHVLATEYGSTGSGHDFATTPHSDYFWMRLDRSGNTYTAYVSDSATANPDLVAWTVLGSVPSTLINPQIGIGGWNSVSTTGLQADFDYFRLQVPEPSAFVLLALAVATAVAGQRNR